MASVTLNWTPWGGAIATSQKVQRKLVGGSYSTIATVGPSVNTYTDNTAIYDTGYMYRILTVCSTGVETPSSEINVVTGIANPPNEFYLFVPGAPPQALSDNVVKTTSNITTILGTINYFDTTWSASLWVKPEYLSETGTQDSGFTLFGLQSDTVSTNKTRVIAAVKNYSGGSILILKFIDSADNYIQWEYLLSGGSNQAITGIPGSSFYDTSTVNVFKHIVITHDHTQASNTFKVKAYWNGNPLTLTGNPVSSFNKTLYDPDKIKLNFGWLEGFTNAYQGHVLAKSIDEYAFYAGSLLTPSNVGILYNSNVIKAPYYIFPQIAPSLSYSFEQPDFYNPNFGVAGAILVETPGYGTPSTSEPH